MLRARPNDYVAQELVHLSQAPVWDRAHAAAASRRARSACASSPAPRPNGYVVHARRPDARGERGRRARHLDAARRLEQGHLGARRRPGQHLQPAAPLDRRAGPGARRHQPVEPRGGEPVLVRPLLRALRRRRRACCASRSAASATTCRATTTSAPGRCCSSCCAAPACCRRRRRTRATRSCRRALRAAITDDTQPGLASGAAPADARRLQPARAPVARQLAHAEPPDAGPDAAPRRARRAFSDLLGELDLAIASLHHALGLRARRHDARPGLALPVHRPAPRAAAVALHHAQADASPGPPRWTSPGCCALADSIITYRARYMARPEWLPVLDLLVRDEANPRSIAFQVHGLRDYAQRLVDLFGDFGDEHFHGALTRPAADRPRRPTCSRAASGCSPGSTNGRPPPTGTASSSACASSATSAKRSTADLRNLMRLHVIHETHYRYSAPGGALAAAPAPHAARAALADAASSTASPSSPPPARSTSARTTTATAPCTCCVAAPHEALLVRAESDVDVQPRARERRAAEAAWEAVRARLHALDAPPLLEPAEFLYESPHVERSRELADYAVQELQPRGAACSRRRATSRGASTRTSRSTAPRPASRRRCRQVLEGAARRVPGLRAPDDRLPALDRARRRAT